MKKLYWRPQRISLRVLLLLAAVALGGLVSVEAFRVRERQPYYKEKMSAARLALRGFDVIKEEKQRRGIPIDPDADPAGSGLIGVLLSAVTTNPGHLPSKQTSINANFAAVVIDMLKRAGVEDGDVVAVGMSGSFPAINISVMAAVETLKLKPIVISSIGASQWGANNPELMWPEMERMLIEKRIFTTRSAAFSRGGIEDRALGLSKQGRQLLDSAIDRSGVAKLDVKNYTESVDRRMTLYRELAGAADIKAYINVGGGTTSVGTRVGKKMFKPGLNRSLPRGSTAIDSIMTRFVLDGVPVIHLTMIDEIAQRHDLPVQPQSMPAVGEGSIFMHEEYNRWMAAGVLLVVLLMAIAFVRMDWGYRLLVTGRRDAPHGRPEQMV